MDHWSVELSRFLLGAKLGMLLQRVLRGVGSSEGEEPGQLDRQLDRPKAASPGPQTRPSKNGQHSVSIHPISQHLGSGQCEPGLVRLLVGTVGDPKSVLLHFSSTSALGYPKPKAICNDLTVNLNGQRGNRETRKASLWCAVCLYGKQRRVTRPEGGQCYLKPQ